MKRQKCFKVFVEGPSMVWIHVGDSAGAKDTDPEKSGVRQSYRSTVYRRAMESIKWNSSLSSYPTLRINVIQKKNVIYIQTVSENRAKSVGPRNILKTIRTG